MTRTATRTQWQTTVKNARVISRHYRALTGDTRHVVIESIGNGKYAIGRTEPSATTAYPEHGTASKQDSRTGSIDAMDDALYFADSMLAAVRYETPLTIPTMIQRFARELGGVDLLSFNGNHWIATWRSVHPRYWTIDLHIHGDRAYVRLWWGRDEGFPNAALLSLGIENRAPYNDIWVHYANDLNQPCRYEWTHDQKGNTAFVTYQFDKEQSEFVPVIISVDPAQMVAWFHDVPRPTA